MKAGKLNEECGVFGIYSSTPTDAAHEVYLGLYALQHRGQESVGISVCDGCFTGEYPVDVSGCGEKNKFEEKIHK